MKNMYVVRWCEIIDNRRNKTKHEMDYPTPDLAAAVAEFLYNCKYVRNVQVNRVETK